LGTLESKGVKKEGGTKRKSTEEGSIKEKVK